MNPLWFVLALLAYFGVLIALSFYRRRADSGTDYFLGGRTMPAWMLAMAFAASWYGGNSALISIDAANKAAGRRLPAGVRYSAECRRINIMANAPFMTDSACRMWSLTDEEKASMRDILHSHSLHIVDEWARDDGIAFIVTSAKNSGGNL